MKSTQSKTNLKGKKLPREYWRTFGTFKKRFFVFYQGLVLDLTDFLEIHPGGIQAIKNYKNKDIAKLIFTVYPHPQSIIKTLLKYKVGLLDETELVSQNTIRSLGKKQKSNLKTSSLTKLKKRLSIALESDDDENDSKSKCSIATSSKKVVFLKRNAKDRNQTRKKTFFYYNFENAAKKKKTNNSQDHLEEYSDSDKGDFVQQIPMFSSKFLDQAI